MSSSLDTRRGATPGTVPIVRHTSTGNRGSDPLQLPVVVSRQSSVVGIEVRKRVDPRNRVRSVHEADRIEPRGVDPSPDGTGSGVCNGVFGNIDRFVRSLASPSSSHEVDGIHREAAANRGNPYVVLPAAKTVESSARFATPSLR